MMLYREANCPSPPYQRLRIEDAGPRELMDAGLMKEAALGLSPWARLDGDVLAVIGGRAFAPGAVLTLWDDYGHRYIYRVLRYDWQKDVFELEWPD